MATTKPRITITLTARQHEVLRAISESSGQAMSAMLSEFIDLAMPTFERMAATFQQLKRAQDLERSKVLSALEHAQSALEPIAQEAAGQFDLFMQRIDGAVVLDRSEARTTTTATASPSTNRGDTPRKGTGRKASNGKASKAVPAAKVLKKSGA